MIRKNGPAKLTVIEDKFKWTIHFQLVDLAAFSLDYDPRGVSVWLSDIPRCPLVVTSESFSSLLQTLYPLPSHTEDTGDTGDTRELHLYAKGSKVEDICATLGGEGGPEGGEPNILAEKPILSPTANPNPASPAGPAPRKPYVKAQYDPRFLVFWDAYPRKQAKWVAQLAFNRLNPDGPTFDQIMLAIRNQQNTDAWKRDGGKYIPLPGTWLNGRRWEDEVTEEKSPVDSIMDSLQE